MRASSDSHIGLSGGTCVHFVADLYQPDLQLGILALNSEPSSGQDIGYSLQKLGREKKKTLSEG